MSIANVDDGGSGTQTISAKSTPSVTRAGTGGDGTRAVFLDPPYATSGDLYAVSSDGVAEQVRDWCATSTDGMRVILCGYDSEHDALLEHGWEVIDGKAGGGAGYSTNSANGRRERLWLSPECITAHQDVLDFSGGAA